MLVNPFVAGVFCTLFCEMAIIVIFAILKSFGGKK